MRVLQTISGLTAKSGGPSTCTRDLLEGLYALDAHTDLLTVKSKVSGEQNFGEGSSWLKEVENDYCTPFVISQNARRFLENTEYDLYHCNALWMGINHDTCSIARKKGKPYIISPHGMLYPTALKIHNWKKKILLHLWYNKDIHSAACLHLTCKQEMEYCRDFGYKGPIAIIPNCVVFPQGMEAASSKPSLKKLGYLGRLHPIKKVENLLQGAAIAIERGCEPFRIDIMGKGLDDYEAFLHQEVKRLHLEDVVNFVGFVTGDEKYERLSKLWALMVPSEQENFGMIVPEALICGTPVYASLGTPWEELNTEGCGWWRDNNPEAIADTIIDVLSQSEADILEMGLRGRRLMEGKYEQHKVAVMMLDLYKWILKEGEKPEFVYE